MDTVDEDTLGAPHNLYCRIVDDFRQIHQDTVIARGREAEQVVVLRPRGQGRRLALVRRKEKIEAVRVGSEFGPL